MSTRVQLMPPLNQPWCLLSYLSHILRRLLVRSDIAFIVEFDAATLTFAFAGSPDSKLAITAKADIARSVAQLTLLALSPDLAVPDVVYVAGQNASYREIGQAIEGVSGESGAERKKVTLNAADLESYKIAAREEEVRTGKPNILKHIKYGIRLLLNIVTDPRLWRRQDRTRGAQDGLLI